MNGSERGGNNRRRPFKRRENDGGQRGGKKAAGLPADGGRYEKGKSGFFERPRWSPPQMATDPIPSPDCAYCGKPIKDMSAAISDKAGGAPVHFDCVIARIAEGEILEPGDEITYIGGGRFGIVNFNPQSARDFKIKKILEWEDKEYRAEWRASISDHYSVT
jgi:hypothetical protein